jgi:Acetyltransferase (GNAT) domain
MLLIGEPSAQLLSCNTWYVVEHPDDDAVLISCGGWTPGPPGSSKYHEESRHKRDSIERELCRTESTSNREPSSTKGKGEDSAAQPGNSEKDGATQESSEYLNYHLRHFATDPDWLRKGIARAIVQRSFQDALIECKSSPVTWNVYSSLFAVDFYGSFGFTTLKEVNLPLSNENGVDGPCLPCILMELLWDPDTISRLTAESL